MTSYKEVSRLFERQPAYSVIGGQAPAATVLDLGHVDTSLKQCGFFERLFRRRATLRFFDAQAT
jgi:hypothetical protein